MRLKFLAAAAVSVLACHAQANTFDWGTHGVIEVGVNLPSPGDINDIFKFVLDDGASVVSSAVALASPGLLNISNGTVNLYKESGSEDSLLGSYTFDGTTGSIFHTFDVSTPGEYYYQVVGQATGSLGGYYSLSSATTAVPEPATLALVLGGLVATGGAFRRRVQSGV